MKKKGSKKKPSFKKSPTGKKAKKAVPAKKSKSVTRAAKPAKPSGVCQFVCSECYAEFILPANFSEETLSCPECLHVGKRPDEDFLRTVLIHKSQERKSLAMTVGVGILLFVVILFLIWQVSPFATAGDPPIPSVALLGIGGVLLLALLALMWRYEGNRWEVYF